MMLAVNGRERRAVEMRRDDGSWVLLSWVSQMSGRQPPRPRSRSCNGKDHMMAPLRMMFTSRPLAGHFEPLVPLAVAARAAGHTVAFATGEPYTSRARECGFGAFHAGPDEGFRAE